MRRFLRMMVVNVGTAGELMAFLWRRKYWWLVPMVAVLLLFGLLVILGATSGLGPFIYPLF